jgi:glycosyltransferase involved in cell wall biosynthesis
VILAKVLFWVCLLCLAYVEVGYLLLLWVVARVRGSTPPPLPPLRQGGGEEPSVTVLIAAHNEEQVIRSKLENTLGLDYPRERLEVIVASDGSTDGTDAIVKEFAGRGVRLCRTGERRGKVAALRAAQALATGEILVISDADSHYEPDALRRLVAPFSDPKVGAVSGHETRRASGGQGQGEGLYSRLDNVIKELEGRVGSQVMVNGGFFAIRSERMPIVPDHLTHDGVVPPTLYLEGTRTAYVPEAISLESYALDSRQDFSRRVRTVLQALQSYWHVKAALGPLRTGFYAVQIWSHRILRWLVFPVLMVMLGTSLWLAARSWLYAVLAGLQGACYLLALAGWLIDRLGKRITLFYIPFYFVYVHLAAFWAVLMALGGKRIAAWRPTQRRGNAG